MVREVVTLLRELRPEEGLGEGIDQLAALVHHAYLFWDAGAADVELPARTAGCPAGRRRRQTPSTASRRRPTTPSCREHRIWAQVIPGHPPSRSTAVSCTPRRTRRRSECSASSESTPSARGSAWSKQPDRGRWRWRARTGPSCSAPTLAGGQAAGLFSITGEEELLELGWRIQQLGAGSWELGARGSELGVAGSQLPAPSS